MNATNEERKRLAEAGEEARQGILTALTVLTERDGRPPTIREICAFTGKPSTGNVSYHLRRMESWGMIENLGGTRCYKVVKR